MHSESLKTLLYIAFHLQQQLYFSFSSQDIVFCSSKRERNKEKRSIWLLCVFCTNAKREGPFNLQSVNNNWLKDFFSAKRVIDNVFADELGPATTTYYYSI